MWPFFICIILQSFLRERKTMLILVLPKRNKMNKETKNTAPQENKALKADYIKHLLEAKNFHYNV